MGVTIYYGGTLKTPSDVHALVSEVRDIAHSNQWRYDLLDDSWDSDITVSMDYEDEEPVFDGNSGLKGIALHTHPDLDQMTLLFDGEGKTRTREEVAYDPKRRLGVTHISTQRAGVDIHIQLVNFLKYVGDKYMSEWRMEDDSGYLTHQDRDKARQVFEAIEDAINAVTEAFDTIEMPEDITGREEEFLSLVEDRIRTFLPGIEVRRIEEHEDSEEEE